MSQIALDKPSIQIDLSLITNDYFQVPLTYLFIKVTLLSSSYYNVIVKSS